MPFFCAWLKVSFEELPEVSTRNNSMFTGRQSAGINLCKSVKKAVLLTFYCHHISQWAFLICMYKCIPLPQKKKKKKSPSLLESSVNSLQDGHFLHKELRKEPIWLQVNAGKWTKGHPHGIRRNQISETTAKLARERENEHMLAVEGWREKATQHFSQIIPHVQLSRLKLCT